MRTIGILRSYLIKVIDATACLFLRYSDGIFRHGIKINLSIILLVQFTTHCTQSKALTSSPEKNAMTCSADCLETQASAELKLDSPTWLLDYSQEEISTGVMILGKIKNLYM